jgi:hypothetical protein
MVEGNMNQRIHVMLPQIQTWEVTDNAAFTLRKDRKHHWLQRVCCWILAKLDCYQTHRGYTVQTVSFDAQTIHEAVSEQVLAIKDVYNLHQVSVIVGRDHYRQFMDEIHEYPFRIDTDMRIARSVIDHWGVRDTQYKILGLRVYFVPWLDGFLVLPGTIESKL